MITIDNKQMQWQPGMTLDQAIAFLEEAAIYAVVRLNGKLVSKPHFASTLITDGSVVEPIPLIAGG